jgi:amidase
VSTWHDELKATRDPIIKEQCIEQESELVPRFAEHYQQLKALRRRVRWSLQGNRRHPAAGLSLLLCAGLLIGSAHAAPLTCSIAQITHSTGSNVEPAIDGVSTHIAFAPNRDLSGGNADTNDEIFLYDTDINSVTQIVKSPGRFNVALAGRPRESMKAEFWVEEATISDIHAAMQAGMLTSRELVEMYLRRIRTYDQKGPKLNSVILVNPRALQLADELDAKFKNSGFVGSLHGIPVLLKDNVDTHDMQTTGGSLSLKGYVPPADATITKKLKRAGAIILAKMNLHEFAIWGETVNSILGQTLNPYDLTRTPGGSSGGTGAGIAANFGVVGIGTDTVNSIRSPASANSLVGIRPTLGLVSREGIIPYSFTQDAVGPITRTVTDAVKTLNVLVGYDPADPATARSIEHIHKDYTQYLDPNGLKGARIGVLKGFFGKEPIHQEVNEVTNAAIETMKQLGAVIVSIDNPEFDSDRMVNEISVHLYDLKPHLNTYLGDPKRKTPVKSLAEIIASGKYHPSIEENIKDAQALSHDDPEYKERLHKRMELKKLLMQVMTENNLDALVYPHQQRLVVPIGQTQVDRNGVLASVTGSPAITLPGGFSKPTASAPIGVPVGIEILGQPWSEPSLIRIAYAFEQGTTFRRPPQSTPALP